MLGIHRQRSGGQHADRMRAVMDRDRRLTGFLRGQTDNVKAPKGFELSNPWRVRISRIETGLVLICYSLSQAPHECNCIVQNPQSERIPFQTFMSLMLLLVARIVASERPRLSLYMEYDQGIALADESKSCSNAQVKEETKGLAVRCEVAELYLLATPLALIKLANASRLHPMASTAREAQGILLL